MQQYQPTFDLAHFCATLHAKELPAQVRERVRYLLLDHLAVTLRGSLQPSSQSAYTMLENIRATGKEGTSTIFGRAAKAEASWAAFANGIAAHGLEMDDVENASSLHPGWACHAGITAAHLAAAGFVGPSAILEGRYGFLHAYSSKSDVTQLERRPGNELAIMRVSLKPYACCRYMHGPMTASSTSRAATTSTYSISRASPVAS